MVVRGKIKPIPQRVTARREVAAIFERAEAKRAQASASSRTIPVEAKR
jgi:hypothetical protein